MGQLGVFEGLGFCHPSLRSSLPPSLPPSLSRLIPPVTGFRRAATQPRWLLKSEFLRTSLRGDFNSPALREEPRIQSPASAQSPTRSCIPSAPAPRCSAFSCVCSPATQKIKHPDLRCAFCLCPGLPQDPEGSLGTFLDGAFGRMC